MNLDTWIADLVRPVRPLEELELPLVDARGHVLAADVPSQLPIPPWDNSAMDGFAVRTADLVRASATSPVRLAVTGEVLAGDAADPPLPGGAAIRIMTGAPLPSAADAVVPVEHTRPLGGRSGDWGTGPIEVLRAPEQGDNIRRSGEDVAAGDLLARTGEVLGPTRIAALASGGISRVRVHRRPRVALLLTGAELTCPGGELRRGSVPESNGILLASRLAELGHDLVLRETVDDDLAAVAFALERARRDVDLVITTGGVGPGTHDAVRQVLTPLPDVHRAAVAMKPARHQMGGLLPDGTAVVALPGNPVAAWVSFELVVRPVLSVLAGRPVAQPKVVELRAESSWPGAGDRLLVLPVRIRRTVEGVGCVPAVPPGRISHAVGSLAQSEGLALIPAGHGDVRVGSPVRVLLTSPAA
jgi:molybdopterin molybdotransferase